MGARGAHGLDQLERDRRLNSVNIPWTFTDLLAAALQCLPAGRPTQRATLAERLREAVALAEADGAEEWPLGAGELFRRCREVCAERCPVLPGSLIGPAVDVIWPARRAQAWQERADLQ